MTKPAKTNHTPPETQGEFDVIRRHFVRPHTMGAHVVLGPGDDCAVLATTPHTQLAVSSDMLVAGRHFFADTDPKRLGHKALAVNLSDLAAMGARAHSFTLSLALPNADDTWLQQFSEGLFALAAQHACSLVGGDTTRGPLNICITVMGDVQTGQGLRRSGAQVGDTVWVSGAVGEAAWALGVLNQDPQACALRALASPPAWQQALDRLEAPTPRNTLGLALRDLATSAMDISDGLAGDLQHILRASGVSARIDIDALPTAPALHVAEPALRRHYAAAGGDDYELLFTAPPDKHDAVIAAGALCGVALTPVGRITDTATDTHTDTDNAITWVDTAGDVLDARYHAFDHFKATATPRTI
jgi:thiamine-monophosphate kinase